jgi:RNA polymerase-binding transcription factor DksA
MVDEVDVSSKNVEKEIETALKNIDTTIPKNKTGKCWTCGVAVPDDRRWCSVECRDEYERNEKAP